MKWQEKRHLATISLMLDSGIKWSVDASRGSIWRGRGSIYSLKLSSHELLPNCKGKDSALTEEKSGRYHIKWLKLLSPTLGLHMPLQSDVLKRAQHYLCGIPTTMHNLHLIRRKSKTDYKIADQYSSKCPAPNIGISQRIIYSPRFLCILQIGNTNSSCGHLTGIWNMAQTNLNFHFYSSKKWSSHIQLVSKCNPFYPPNILCILSLLSITLATSLVYLLLKCAQPTSPTSRPPIFLYWPGKILESN